MMAPGVFIERDEMRAETTALNRKIRTLEASRSRPRGSSATSHGITAWSSPALTAAALGVFALVWAMLVDVRA